MNKTSFTEQEVKDYLSNSNICPCCKNEDITASDISANYNTLYRMVRCRNCNAEWTEEFEMKNITLDVFPDMFKINNQKFNDVV